MKNPLNQGLMGAALLLWGLTAPLLAATTNVQYGFYYFDPNFVSIHVGDTVVWTNQSTFLGHTVTGTGADPVCGPGAAGTGCSHTFTTAGTYPYQCFVPGHAGLGMTGVVQVLDIAVPPPGLTNALRLTNGLFQFTITTTANQTNVVQASTNLNSPTNWTVIATLVPTNNAVTFTDSNAPSFGIRLYRVKIP